ncbi:MAG: manganese catalase family protein [Firmicutes bacterium]|nr:manganese catalase family protein [Bacillota bacterium]
MFKHEKQLLHPVKVDKPNPRYAAMLHEQLGGPNGELKAGLQYISQSFRVKDPAIRDLFMDIGTEELGHMEMVATTINMLHGHDLQAEQAVSGSIEPHVLGGLVPMLTDASGHPFSGTYINATGDLPADILSNIAAEQRAKVVYEYLYRQINDKGVRETIDFLLNREEAHNALFREALNKVQGQGSTADFGVTEDSKLYFDLSAGERHFEDPRPTPPAANDPRRH